MRVLIKFLVFLSLPLLSFAQWQEDLTIIKHKADLEGYLCRFIYNTGDSLFETNIFLPCDENNFNEEILCKLSKYNGEMLYRKPLESYIFNQYILSLNYYVIAPNGMLNITHVSDKAIKYYSYVLKIKIPDSVDNHKEDIVLYSRTNGISRRYIKKGIFLVYFGKQKVCGTLLSIKKNAHLYFNLNEKWETDIRRWSWGGIIAKYTKSKDNRYIDIRFIY